MLTQHGIQYDYREYREQPLSVKELKAVLLKLGVRPGSVLRTRDRAFSEQGLTGHETDEQLIRLMSTHPTLLQRPIGILGTRAVVGRPPEQLLELFQSNAK